MESEGFSGAKSVPGKSRFAQTCSLLSQRLKEKRSSGNLSVQMAGLLQNKGMSELSKPTKTMNLVSQIEKASKDFNCPDLNMVEEDIDITESGPESRREIPNLNESTTPPTMTIFYNGRVLVFDNLPESKANEIVQLACSTTMTHSRPASFSTTSSPPPSGPTTTSSVGAGLSGMPIARRTSVCRFMEKRRDRVAAKAPYPPQNPPASSSKKEDQKNKEIANLASCSPSKGNLESSAPPLSGGAATGSTGVSFPPPRPQVLRFMEKRKDRVVSTEVTNPMDNPSVSASQQEDYNDKKDPSAHLQLKL